MTKDDFETPEGDFDVKSYYLQMLGWSLVFSFTLIALIVVGLAAAHYLNEPEANDFWIMVIGLPLVLAGSYVSWRWMPDWTMGEPDTPRGRRVRWVLVGCGVLGGLASVPFTNIDGGGSLLFSNGPMPSTPALIAAALRGLAMPVLMILFRRNADEVTREANNFGLSVGFQVFAYAAPLWWVGWRGGFLPVPDVMILFVATLVVATVANIGKQFA
ncbi:MAG: hypothetical protein AAFQ90_11820 [Pseudomonadota bacterium]